MVGLTHSDVLADSLPGEIETLQSHRQAKRVPLEAARNAGVDQDWMLAALDLDGLPRIDSQNVDMGAYERVVPPRGSLFTIR